MAAPQRLKRRACTGALLRSLGDASWAAEQTPSGIAVIENGIADAFDPTLKDRLASLKTERDRAKAAMDR